MPPCFLLILSSASLLPLSSSLLASTCGSSLLSHLSQMALLLANEAHSKPIGVFPLQLWFAIPEQGYHAKSGSQTWLPLTYLLINWSKKGYIWSQKIIQNLTLSHISYLLVRKSSDVIYSKTFPIIYDVPALVLMQVTCTYVYFSRMVPYDSYNIQGSLL